MSRPDPIRRNAFALPLALVLVLVSSVMIVVMLERQQAQQLTVQRELEGYTFHHITKGFGETFEVWLRSAGARNIREALGTNGHAFDLSVEGGQSVKVSLYDGQGTVLADLAGLTDDQILLGRAMLRSLQQQTGADWKRYTRREGPLAVSIRGSPREVLLAAADAALSESGDPESLVSALEDARDSAGDEPIDLAAVMDAADLPPEVRAKVASVFAVDPALWRGVATAESPGTWPPRPPVQYQFWSVVRSSGSMRDPSAALQRSSLIIRWERLQSR